MTMPTKQGRCERDPGNPVKYRSEPTPLGDATFNALDYKKEQAMGKPGQSTSRQEGNVQRPWGRSQHGMFEQHRLFQAKTRQGLKPYWKQSLKSQYS